MDEARAWAREIADRSPTAITLAKASFNAESEHIRGVGAVALRGLALDYGTDEAAEGKNAFLEKRKPDFRKFRRCREDDGLLERARLLVVVGDPEAPARRVARANP